MQTPTLRKLGGHTTPQYANAFAGPQMIRMVGKHTTPQYANAFAGPTLNAPSRLSAPVNLVRSFACAACARPNMLTNPYGDMRIVPFQLPGSELDVDARGFSDDGLQISPRIKVAVNSFGDFFGDLGNSLLHGVESAVPALVLGGVSAGATAIDPGFGSTVQQIITASSANTAALNNAAQAAVARAQSVAIAANPASAAVYTASQSTLSVPTQGVDPSGNMVMLPAGTLVRTMADGTRYVPLSGGGSVVLPSAPTSAAVAMANGGTSQAQLNSTIGSMLSGVTAQINGLQAQVNSSLSPINTLAQNQAQQAQMIAAAQAQTASTNQYLEIGGIAALVVLFIIMRK